MRKTVVAGLEINIFTRTKDRNLPIIFVTHGRLGRVEDVFEYAEKLSESGFIVIAIDERNHGNRMVRRRYNEDSNQHPTDTYGIIVGTAYDISTIIDFLPLKCGFTSEQIGVTGISLGGHVSFLSLVIDSRIKVAVPIIGAADYQTLMVERKLLYEGMDNFGVDKFYPEKLDILVKKYDPINNTNKIKDRPILMINGDKDEIVPKICNQNFYNKIIPLYKDKSLIKLSLYPTKHTINESMYNEAICWFEKYLK